MQGACAGRAAAQYLLEHQAEIPREMRGKYLVFTGTIFRAPNGHEFICQLHQGDGRSGPWHLCFRRLDFEVTGRSRLVGQVAALNCPEKLISS